MSRTRPRVVLPGNQAPSGAGVGFGGVGGGNPGGPVFVGASTLGAGASSATPTLHPDTLENDVHLAIASATGNTPFTWPAGWVELFAVDASGTRRHECRWKRHEGGDTDPTVSIGAANVIAVAVGTWRGCPTSGSPIAAISATQVSTVATLTYPDVTSPQSNCELVLVGAISNNVTVSGYSGSQPTPAERFDYQSATGSTAAVHMASGPQAAAGASGARTATRSAGTTPATCCTIYLKGG